MRRGESKERTEWHKVVIFDERLATIAATYLAKGVQVSIEGQLQTRKLQDQAGQECYSIEVDLSLFVLRFAVFLAGGSYR